METPPRSNSGDKGGFSFDHRLVREKPAVVLDLGYSLFKCGLSQEHSPRHVSPSTLPEFLNESSRRPTWKKWTTYASKLLKWVFFVALQTKPTERPVVVVENFLMPSQFRKALVYCLFDVYEVPLVLMLPTPVASLTLTGANTGIVIDIGEQETRVMPVFENHMVYDAFVYQRLGVADALEVMTQRIISRRSKLVQSLEESSFCDTTGLLEQLKDISDDSVDQTWLKDLAFRLAAVYSKKEADAKRGEDSSPPAQDDNDAKEGDEPTPTPSKGNAWPLLQSIVEASPLLHDIVRSGFEVLIQGNCEGHSVVSLVLDCLCRCPIDLRATLAQNVILTGGGAATANLAFRVQDEIDEIMQTLYEAEEAITNDSDEEEPAAEAKDDADDVPFDGRYANISCLEKYHGIRVRPLAPFNNALAAWTGASVFASSTAFNRTEAAPEGDATQTPTLTAARPGAQQYQFQTISLTDFQAERMKAIGRDRFDISSSNAEENPERKASPLASMSVAKHFVNVLKDARDETRRKSISSPPRAATADDVGSEEWVKKMKEITDQAKASVTGGGGAKSSAGKSP